jgi:hypothetical protein
MSEEADILFKIPQEFLSPNNSTGTFEKLMLKKCFFR